MPQTTAGQLAMDGRIVCLVILSLFVHVAESLSSPITIYVSANGTFNSSCLRNLGECANLTQALVYSSSQFKSNLAILIQPAAEPYRLSAKAFFHASSNVTISGIGEIPARVSCTDGGAGIAFSQSERVVIRNLSFSGCGTRFLSTSRNLSVSSEVITFIPFNVSLYFQQCANIVIDFVTVTNSTGVGMQIYATSGINYITNSNFTFNPSVENRSLTRCGGLYIEFPYCLPGDSSCNDTISAMPSSDISNSMYYITNCLFAENYAIVEDINSTFILPYKSNHDAFGRGGGLSLFVKSNATNNSVLISNSTFRNNHAIFGGGLMVEFHDDAAYNNIIIKDCNFSNNNASQGGGGSRMTFIAYQSSLNNNIISTAQCFFSNNNAIWGGGVTFLTTKEQRVTEPSNKLYYNDTVWTRNIARLGSAIDMTIFHPCLKGEVVNIQFFRCTFSENSNWYPISLGNPVGMGAVYFDSVHGTFSDSVLFADNSDGSALVGLNSQIYFSTNTSTVFTDNIGRNGGAISLLGNAILILGEHTKFNFTRNLAYGVGGAIYSFYSGNRELINSRNCFFQYFNIVSDPQDWNVEFVFEENKPETSIIFSTTIIPCLWGRSTGPTEADNDKLTKVFCWNDQDRKWVYDNKIDSDSCKAAIKTDPASLDIHTAEALTITPGISAGLELSATDDQNENVTDLVVFTVQDMLSFGAEVDETYHYISNNRILLKPIGMNTSATIHLETSSPRMLIAELNITFTECHVGYNLNENGSCVPNGNYGGRVSYTLQTYEAALLRGYWIGIMDNSTTPVVAQCKYCEYDTPAGFITLEKTLHEASLQFCKPNRSGYLCAQCANGTAPAFNIDNYNCVECDEQRYRYNWIFFVLLKLIIPLLMFILLYITNFSLTSGLLNGAILSAQMITTAVSVHAKGAVDYGIDPEIFHHAYTVLYDIWNLDFCQPCFKGMCVAPNTTSVQVLASNYFVAFLPLVIVFIALFVYWLDFLCGVCKIGSCNNGCGVLAKLCTLVKGSAPTALAALIILSYTKIAVITAYLLSRQHLITENGTSLSHKVMYFDGTIPYFGRTHLPYAIPAVIVGIPFLIIIPVMLVVYRYDDPDNNGGFFNHILKEFQREFRDGLPREPPPQIGNDDDSEQVQCHPAYSTVPNEKDYHVPFGCCKVEDKLQYWYAFNTERMLCGCKIKCCHGNCWCYTLWSRHDFRWVSGFYFILRLALLMCFCYDFPIMVMYQLQIIMCLVSAMFILIAWPYKERIHNVLDAGWLLLLVAIISLSSFQLFRVSIDFQPEAWASWLQNILLFLPAVWITFCVLVIETQKQKTYQKVWKVIKLVFCCTRFGHHRYFHLLEDNGEGNEDQANDSIMDNHAE